MIKGGAGSGRVEAIASGAQLALLSSSDPNILRGLNDVTGPSPPGSCHSLFFVSYHTKGVSPLLRVYKLLSLSSKPSRGPCRENPAVRRCSLSALLPSDRYPLLRLRFLVCPRTTNPRGLMELWKHHLFPSAYVLGSTCIDEAPGWATHCANHLHTQDLSGFLCIGEASEV